jgi:hypothetical protein
VALRRGIPAAGLLHHRLQLHRLSACSAALWTEPDIGGRDLRRLYRGYREFRVGGRPRGTARAAEGTLVDLSHHARGLGDNAASSACGGRRRTGGIYVWLLRGALGCQQLGRSQGAAGESAGIRALSVLLLPGIERVRRVRRLLLERRGLAWRCRFCGSAAGGGAADFVAIILGAAPCPGPSDAGCAGAVICLSLNSTLRVQAMFVGHRGDGQLRRASDLPTNWTGRVDGTSIIWAFLARLTCR